jgi:hypothetical protein
MGKRTLLQSFVLLAIQGEKRGTIVKLPELYEKLRNLLTIGPPSGAPPKLVALCSQLRECTDRGDLLDEPRWKNDIRWALRHARNARIIKHIGTLKSGEWVRT